VQIHPDEEDYGFEIEEKNKAIIVKSVTRGSYAEVLYEVEQPSSKLSIAACRYQMYF